MKSSIEQILKEAHDEVIKWPIWKFSDEIKIEFPNLIKEAIKQKQHLPKINTNKGKIK